MDPVTLGMAKADAKKKYGRGYIPSGITLNSTYDPRLNLYNLKPTSLRTARARFAGSVTGNGQFVVGHAGDSTTEGIGSGGTPTIQLENSWPEQFADLLTSAGAQRNGRGWIPFYTNNTGVWPQWVKGSGWTTLGKLPWGLSNATSSVATFTSVEAGPVLQLRYTKKGASFTWSLDGGAQTGTVTTDGTNTFGTLTLSGLANTTHSIQITSGTNSQIVAARVGDTIDKGLVVANFGVGSSVTADWRQSDLWYSGFNVLAGMSPHLSTIMMGINDIAGAVSVATFKANVQTGITALKAVGDVLLITPAPGATYDLTAYRQALYELADTNDVPLLDLVDRWGTYAIQFALGMYNDTLHPNQQGYRDIAQCIRSALAV